MTPVPLTHQVWTTLARKECYTPMSEIIEEHYQGEATISDIKDAVTLLAHQAQATIEFDEEPVIRARQELWCGNNHGNALITCFQLQLLKILRQRNDWMGFREILEQVPGIDNLPSMDVEVVSDALLQIYQRKEICMRLKNDGTAEFCCITTDTAPHTL